ncbi:hypothetical protein GLOIN_2v1550031 [Rhizophagus irregularis DAOM 181602=DAOM 197198]|uniref:Uncharacterized protein n=1 Tax=Rhizophagus irregularis (strain DAOM 181602 / DAOM 197198 / MUCL 43194) TaxID=747089 RepID=A0A2P4QHS0_RHIID|nr:hypothetical protein GLOIN_2v1550031 [Rhizophagus irregularis DAOM 181602=DAOM 197198]POG77189.1 hypothetical protein GLOIN_2v1550031 [Rhizophagus irregularis DAOM 181602=DAOM 197198]|eukprot:XP_025184055.1 hypothetical protein GLOIN_2v1550031 [Rhizophagus irregularis DAOM 181602=DAOM 197198]
MMNLYYTIRMGIKGNILFVFTPYKVKITNISAKECTGYQEKINKLAYPEVMNFIYFQIIPFMNLILLLKK